MYGKIIKGIAGFYYVYVSGSGLYECKAKGIFRKDNVKPLVGDNVQVTSSSCTSVRMSLSDLWWPISTKPL